MAAHRLITLSVAVLLAALLVPAPLEAQTPRRDADQRSGREAAAPMFPDATREEPGARISQRFSRPINQMVEALNEGDPAKARELATAVMDNPRANPRERSFAAQVAGIAAAEQDDIADAIAYMQRALTENGLENEGHYQVMQNLAIMQLNNDQAPDAIATLTRLIDETKTKNADVHHVLANAYFHAENYPRAIATLKTAIALSPEPRAEWLNLLMVAYTQTDQPAEAIAIGTKLLAKTPDDKRLLFTMASNHIDLDQADQAVALLENARARGLFTEARDYQALYALYFNAEGRERDVISVIEEGLAKSILKRDLPTLTALAQAAYFAEDLAKAIVVYTEAAALDPSGETALNLSKVLSGEGQDAAARDAAKAALDKGVGKPGEAWMVIARSESLLDNRAATRAALQRAAEFPESREQAKRMLSQFR